MRLVLLPQLLSRIDLMFIPRPPRLSDSQLHFPQAATELIIVEGESASESVSAVRNPQLQAVFTMQGKPLNAWRAKPDKVLTNEFYRQLALAIGVDLPVSSTDKRRYQQIVLLFDPDADGIHCAALIAMFLLKWMRPLLDEGLVRLVRAPQFDICGVDPEGEIRVLPAYSAPHRDQLKLHLQQQGWKQLKVDYLRGLGNFRPERLRETCVDPLTRKEEIIGESFARQALATFGGESNP